MHDLTRAVWRKATHSQGGGNCVEVADLHDGRRAVRDSKNPTGSGLIFTAHEWTTFIQGIRNEDFSPA